MNLLEAMDDPELFGPHFAGPSWATWRAFIASVFGLQIDDGALKTFRQCTGRNEPPTGPAREAWIIAGRRAGKIAHAGAHRRLSCYVPRLVSLPRRWRERLRCCHRFEP